MLCFTRRNLQNRLVRSLSPRFLSSEAAISTKIAADSCNLNIIKSPYPPLPEDTNPPLKEFVTSEWGRLRDKVAMIDGSTGLERTFGDYDASTANLAASLIYDCDIKEDSTIALFSTNHVDYLPILLAGSLTGAKVTPINPLYTRQELSVVLQRSRSSVLIAHESRLDVALASVSDCPLIKHVIVINDFNNHDIPEGTVSLESLKVDHPKGGITETIHAVHRNVKSHPFLLPYSSGTTGLPKGVCLTHNNLVANLQQYDIAEAIGFPETHKLISPLPMFHIYGLLATVLYSGWKGQQVITMSGRFDMEQFCQLVEKHRPERAQLVPPIILKLAKDEVVDKYDVSALEQIISAAAPLGSDIEILAKKRLGLEIKQAWGMSELSPIGTANGDFNSKVGSVGTLVSSTYAKVVDSEGKSLPAHTDGELLIKGPQVMLGYLDDPEKTEECLSETGWLRTGDICHYDEDGYFYITDRLKEMIKVRGYPVAPAELEALLLTHDEVNDVAVIQKLDDESGELPRAYIVKDSSSDLSEDDIKAWVKELVAPYKRLEGGVVFVDEIPKSASGKILRRILRDQLAEEMK